MESQSVINKKKTTGQKLQIDPGVFTPRGVFTSNAGAVKVAFNVIAQMIATTSLRGWGGVLSCHGNGGLRALVAQGNSGDGAGPHQAQQNSSARGLSLSGVQIF
jgi:hypothetical protein